MSYRVAGDIRGQITRSKRERMKEPASVAFLTSASCPYEVDNFALPYIFLRTIIQSNRYQYDVFIHILYACMFFLIPVPFSSCPWFLFFSFLFYMYYYVSGSFQFHVSCCMILSMFPSYEILFFFLSHCSLSSFMSPNHYYINAYI